MFGMVNSGGGAALGSSRSPAAPSSSRTCSAIAIEADRPVERMPPTQA